MTTGDYDLGSGGVLLLPDQAGTHPHVLVQAGKEGTIYLVDRDHMGHYVTPFGPGCRTGAGFDGAIFEDCQAVGSQNQDITSPLKWLGLWGMPAYWNNTLYFWATPESDPPHNLIFPPTPLKAFSLINDGTNLSLGNPNNTSADTRGYPGAGLSISSNGDTNGIVWALSDNGGGSAELAAYDATAVNSQALYSAVETDRYARFSVPTVAFGKVYVGGQTQLTAYGLLPVYNQGKNGPGSGTVISTPAGINCGSVCSMISSPGATVTLTAVPDPGSAMAGWSVPGCSATGPCTVSLAGSATVTATFNAYTAPPASTLNATVSASVPATMITGQQYTATFTVTNTGSSPWNSVGPYCNAFRLGAQNPGDNTTWGAARFELPGTVAVGASVTFSAVVTAPTTPGVYNFQWQMLEECVTWFGSPSNNIAVAAVKVLPPPPPLPVLIGVGMDHQLYTRATLTSPWALVPNSAAVLAVTVLQDGTLVGVGMDNQLYARATLTSPWALVPNSAAVLAVTVLPDGTLVGVGMDHQLYTRASLTSLWALVPNSAAVLAVTALPDGTLVGVGMDYQLYTRATLTSPWALVPNSAAVLGIAATRPALSATVLVNVQANMAAGQPYTATFTVTNTGTANWNPVGSGCNAFLLGSQNPQDNTTWGIGRVPLPAVVAAGSSIKVSATITAPTTPGVYNLQWQMLEECVTWFGSPSNNIPVAVNVLPSGPPSSLRDISDFNHDGKTDFLFQYSNGAVSDWFMNGSTMISGQYIMNSPIPGWTIVGTGDFNADGNTDIVWQYPNGMIAVWFMNGNSYVNSAYIYAQSLPGWTVRGVADFNHDGWPDLLLQAQDGTLVVWYLKGLVLQGGAVISGPQPGWRVAATGDFNGDGQPDILWQNPNAGVTLWLMNGATMTSWQYLVNGPISGWTIVGTGDFNGDGKTDILWQYQDGSVATWYMNGTTFAGSAYIYSQPIPGWTLRYSK